MRGKWREVLCQAGPFVHPRRAAAAMMLLTAASRFGLHYLVSWNSSLLWVEPINVGRALATGNGFANAFGPASGPTAHCSPAYPVLVSLIFRCFGPDSTAAANGVRLLGLLLAGITCGGLVLYSNYCHLNRWVTLGAAFFKIS